MAWESLYVERNLVLENSCDLKNASSAFLGVPFDGTASFRPGSRFGPLAVRRMLLEMEKETSSGDFFKAGFFDVGNVAVVPGNAEKTLGFVEDVLKGVVAENSNVKFLVAGGEHLVSLPAVRVLSEGYRGLQVVSVDAHADLRNDFMGERLSHASVMRRIHELNVGVHLAGVRSASKDEAEYIRRNHLSNYGPEEVESLAKKIKGKPVYLSVDIDVLDPGCAPGVGTPEADGWMFNELRSFVWEILSNTEVVGFDVTEVCPPYDAGDATALAAARLFMDAALSMKRRK
ncbi:N(1)-aminopropylagmatine ureohydrolase [uncultured archaeon]|nr:N(1)-aminopropylagmatine ureohydrolase [uncultured archaeon]